MSDSFHQLLHQATERRCRKVDQVKMMMIDPTLCMECHGAGNLRYGYRGIMENVSQSQAQGMSLTLKIGQ
jgi:hypothetical protein